MTFPAPAARGGKFVRHIAPILLPAVLVVVLLESYRGLPLGIDSSIFAAVGLHLNHGKVLYRDVWDHKPPLVFFLNALALQVRGESPESIRDLQSFFGVVSSSTFYAVLLVLFGSVGLALFGAVLFVFVFYSPVLYGGGNFTEEYGAAFVLLGVLALTVWALRAGRRRPFLLFLSGMAFGTAVLAKEPFAFSALVWFLYVATVGRSGRRRRLVDLGAFIGGCLLPLTAPLAYFLHHGALDAWMEVLRYGFRYTTLTPGDGFVDSLVENLTWINDLLFSRSALLTILFLFGVGSLRDRRLMKRTRYAPLFVLYWAGFAFAATQLSGMFFLHYYLQAAAPVVCFALCGSAYVLRKARSLPRLAQLAVGSAFVFLTIVDFALPGRLADRSTIPSEAPSDPVLELLRELKRPGDLLWVSTGYFARYYLAAGMLSPTPRLALFQHHLMTGPDRIVDESILEGVRDDLLENPPRFLLGTGWMLAQFDRGDGAAGIQSRYRLRLMDSDDHHTLVFERVEDASQSLIEQKKIWASKEARDPDGLPPAVTILLRQLRGFAPQSP